MADPLGIAASIVGVTVPALHGARLLLDDLQNINDAPETVERLKDDVRSVDLALTSLQTVKDQEWKSLGRAVAEESKTTISTCTRACDKFRSDLQRWTRHSGDGRLAWQDRANVGFFKQGRIKTMSEQLQNCKVTIASVVGIATLYSSIRHTHITEEIKKTIVTKQTDITSAIGTTDKQLVEAGKRLEELNTASEDQIKAQSTEDMAEALKQIEEELKALSASRNLLGELLSNAEFHLLPERPESPPSPSSIVPFRRDQDFVERGVLFDQIQQKCAVPGSWTALVGLGGVGKSQLAIEYAYRTREQSPETWVFWVHASNAARFEQSYRDIADKVKIFGRRNPKANIFKIVHDWLHDGKRGKWVLILDNIDDARFLLDSHLDIQAQPGDPDSRASRPLREYLPQSQNGSILITSRSREAAMKLVEQSDIIAVEPMDGTHALVLFEKKLGKQAVSQDVAELAAALEFMPLAIVQAAAYISQRAPRCSVRQYLEQFQKSDRKRTSLLNHEGGQLRRDGEAKNSIIIAWQISFDYILQTRPSAADLLALMSFFDRQGIPDALLRNRTEQGNGQQDQSRRSGSYADDDEANESQSSESDEFENDILALRNYSFISVSADTTTFEMHRLVQLSMRNWLEANEQLNKWSKESIRVLTAAFPSGDYETWADCQVLLPHAREVISHVTGDAEDVLNQAKIAFSTGWYLYLRGEYKSAEKVVRMSVKAREKVLGPEHPDTLTSVSHLGLVLESQGKYEEAEAMHRRDLEGSEKVLGPEHPDTLISVTNLGSVLESQGKYEEAEAMHRRALKGSEKVLGPEHPYTLASVSHLGLVLKSQGKYEEAEAMHRRALKAREKVLGPEHPYTLASVSHLGSVLESQGKYEEAEAMHRRALKG